MGQDATDTAATGTPVTRENLLGAGYREFPPPRLDGDGKRRIYQRPFDDETGSRYAVNFNEWAYMPDGQLTYDASVCMDTDTAGTVWVTLREATIEATEARARKMWEAAGSVYYRVWNGPADDVPSPAPEAAVRYP